MVEQTLVHRLGRSVEVMNAGVSGYGPADAARLLRFLDAKGFAFDAIVYNLYLGNDFPDNLPGTERWSAAALRPIPTIQTTELLSGRSEFYLPNDLHLNDLGNVRAGEFVGERLAQMLGSRESFRAGGKSSELAVPQLGAVHLHDLLSGVAGGDRACHFVESRLALSHGRCRGMSHVVDP